jgi:hypothetical protein
MLDVSSLSGIDLSNICQTLALRRLRKTGYFLLEGQASSKCSLTHCGLKELAPRARFELATLRLTAECSTVELPGNCVSGNARSNDSS